MVNFAQQLSTQAYDAKYLPEADVSIRQEGISNSELLSQAFTGAQEVSKTLYTLAEYDEGMNQKNLKQAAEADKVRIQSSYNDFYRQLSNINKKAIQTGRWTEAETSTRQLMDRYSRIPGIEYAKLLEGVGKADFTSHYSNEKETRKFWNTKNNEDKYKAVEAFRNANPSLAAALTPEETASFIDGVNDSWDTATKYVSQLKSIDQNTQASEYNRVKTQMTEALGNNVVSTAMVEIFDNQGKIKSSADLEVFRAKTIDKLVKAGVPQEIASVVVEQSIQRSGIVDVIKAANTYQTLTSEDINRTIKYNVDMGKAYMGATTNIYSALKVSSDKWQAGEYFNEDLRIAGKTWNDKLGELAKTGTATPLNITTDGSRGAIYAGAVDILKSRLAAPSKGASVNLVFNDAFDFYKNKDAASRVQAYTEILKNMDNPYLEVEIQKLLSSNLPEHRQLGMELQKNRDTMRAAKNIAVYETSGTPGAQSLTQLRQGPGRDLLRVTDKGQLVVIDGSKGFLQSTMVTLTDMTGRYFNNVAVFNKEFEDKFEDAETRKQMLEAGGVPVLDSATETVIGRKEWYLGNFEDTDAGGYTGIGTALSNLQRPDEEPADNTERQNKIREELRAANEKADLKARIERLKEQKKNMSPAALKEYGAGLDKDIKAGEDLLSKLETGDEYVVSSNISRSDTMTNAFMEYQPTAVDYSNLEIGKMLDEAVAADEERESRIGEYDTRLNSIEEDTYQLWKQKLPQQLQSEQDYDLRGYYKETGGEDAEGHLTDKYKKPNHPTFSVESKYYKKGMWAGKWDEDGNFRIPMDTPKEKLSELIEYWRSGAEPTAVLMFDNPKAEKEIKNLEDKVTSYNKQLDDEKESADVKREIRRELAEIRNKIARLYTSIYINTLGDE